MKITVSLLVIVDTTQKLVNRVAVFVSNFLYHDNIMSLHNLNNREQLKIW